MEVYMKAFYILPVLARVLSLIRMSTSHYTRFQRYYLWAIALTAGLILANQVVIQYYLAQKREDAHLINVSGRQRMLSQRITSLAYSYVQRPSKFTRQELDQQMQEWQQMHSSLSSGTLSKGLIADLPEVQERLAQMDFQVRMAIDLLQDVDQLGGQQLYDFQLNQQAFLLEMDRVVLQMEEASDSRLTRIMIVEVFLAALALLILGLELTFLFRRNIAVLTKQNQALEYSNQLLEQYAYATSHQFKEPLQNILNYADLLRRSTNSRRLEEQLAFVDFIEDSAEQMKQKTEAVLQLSLIQNTELEIRLLDCSTLIREVAAGYQPQIRKLGGNLTVNVQQAHLLVDKERFIELWKRLISNALKFAGQDRNPEVVIDGQSDGNYFIFSIRDNGIGIEPQLQEEIFGMFKQLHPRHYFNGQGIGLTLSKAIVEKHRGKLWLESYPGKGSVFYVQLPLK